MLSLLEVFGEIESLVDEVGVLRQGGSGLLEEFVHHADRLLICQLELRIEHIYDVLDRLIRNNGLQGTPSQVGAALRTALSVAILAEVFEDARLAEGV